MSEEQLAKVRAEAAQFKGPDLENWKRNTNQRASAPLYHDGSIA
jgi:hypothetical protein